MRDERRRRQKCRGNTDRALDRSTRIVAQVEDEALNLTRPEQLVQLSRQIAAGAAKIGNVLPCNIPNMGSAPRIDRSNSMSFALFGKEVSNDIRKRMFRQVPKLARIKKAAIAGRASFEPNVRLAVVDHAHHRCIGANGTVDAIYRIAFRSNLGVSSVYRFRVRKQFFVFEHVEPETLAGNTAVNRRSFNG
jgi:hypothetical protein